MSVSLRHSMGALMYDWLPFELRMLGVARRGDEPEPWLQIRNRHETIATDVRGVQCRWRFGSDLHIGKVFPSTAARLMRRALARWPVAMRDAPATVSGPPRISFLIGHRGMARLPHLLATLRNIAAQSIVGFECIVVEQSTAPEIAQFLPSWVRYIHTPLPHFDLPYCRAWAFNVAARHAQSDILVLHDNDVLVPERYASEAVDRMSEGWSFVDLKRFLFYLDAEATTRVLITETVPLNGPALVVQNLDGGTVVARRDAYNAVGGFDESFIGWGGEDNDFFDRAGVLGGVYRFGYLPLLHLDHPPQPGKASQTTGAIRRYRDMEAIDPAARIARLLAVEQGQLTGPAQVDDFPATEADQNGA